MNINLTNSRFLAQTGIKVRDISILSLTQTISDNLNTTQSQLRKNQIESCNTDFALTSLEPISYNITDISIGYFNQENLGMELISARKMTSFISICFGI